MEAADIDEVLHNLDRLGLGPEALSVLRERFPSLRFTVCSADDLDGREPHMSRPGFDVHLLASDGHCLSLTSHADSAMGLVLASRDDE